MGEQERRKKTGRRKRKTGPRRRKTGPRRRKTGQFRRKTAFKRTKKSNVPIKVMKMTPTGIGEPDAFPLDPIVDINDQKKREDTLFDNISADRKIEKKNDDSRSIKPYDKTSLIPSPLSLSTKSNSGGVLSKRLKKRKSNKKKRKSKKNRKSRKKRRSRTARGKSSKIHISTNKPLSKYLQRKKHKKAIWDLFTRKSASIKPSEPVGSEAIHIDMIKNPIN